MDENLKNKGQQYGFYDPHSKQFYIIPASSEEEFKKFLECLGAFQDTSSSKCSK